MARCSVRVLSLVLSLFCALPAMALHNYRATYHLSVRGIGAGQIVYEAFFSDSDYHIDTLATPSIAARLLGFDEIREISRGHLEDASVVPQYYQRVMRGKDKYHLVYDFRNRRHEIKAQIGNIAKVLTYDSALVPLDMLSMMVQSLLDIAAKHAMTRYTIVSEDDIRTYRVEPLAETKWTNKSGTVITLKGYRQSHGSRQTRIYFAEHPLRLVKLEQLKNRESRFALELRDYQILE